MRGRFKDRRKRALIVSPFLNPLAARLGLLALEWRLLVRSHVSLRRGDCFQFPYGVVPPSFDRSAFIKIKLFGVV